MSDLAQASVSDLANYGPWGALLALALLAIGVMYRREVKSNDRERARADKYEELWREEIAKRKARRRDNE